MLSRLKDKYKAFFEGDSVARIIWFYIPLAIQAASMSLTHPLVASIVSHGPLGSDEFAAFAQGNTAMFFLGSIGFGLITTGMVFAKTKTGMRNFTKLNLVIMCAVTTITVLICLTPVHSTVFGGILKMDPKTASISRWTLLLSIPIQSGFFLRNKSLAILYSMKESGKANLAAMVRIAATACLSPLFVKAGLTGYKWGVLAMTIPVWGETGIVWLFSRKYIAQMYDSANSEDASFKKQLKFTIPLSLGGIMQSMSGLMIAVFVSRASNPLIALAIHYIVIGISNPVTMAANRMQPTTIAFPPRYKDDRRMTFTALGVGIALGLVPLFSLYRPLAHWYFGEIQNLPMEHVVLASHAMLLSMLMPLFTALRANAEGRAALLRRPNAILAGQAMYLATMVSSLFAFIESNSVPSYMIGVMSMVISLTTAWLTVLAGLFWAEAESSFGVDTTAIQ